MVQFEHNCELNFKRETLETAIQEKYLFQYIRKNLFLISSNENYRKIYRLSQYGVVHERRSHLKSHPYVIHPFSVFRYYWEIFMVIMFLARFFCISYYVLHMDDIQSINKIYIPLVMAATVTCFIDFHLNFLTGIFDSNKFEIILDPKIYIKRYIFSYALTDLLSCTPFEYIYVFLHIKVTPTNIVAFTFCRFLYIFRFLNYLNRYQQKKEYEIHKFRILQTVLIYILMFFYFITAICIAKVVDNNKSLYNLKYAECASAVANMLFGTAQSPLLTNWTELLVHVLGRLVGITLQIIFISQMVVCLLTRYDATCKYNTHMKELDEYIEFHELPKKLRQKIVTHQDWYYEQKYFNEDEIWALISTDKKNEILYNMLKPHIQESILSICTLDIQFMLISRMRRRLFLPGDILFSANTINNKLFIIQKGSVQLQVDDGYIVAILEEGKIFVDIIPEYAELNKTNRRYTVVAREYVIVYTLKIQALYETLKEYPYEMKFIIRELKRKTKVIQKSPKHELDLDDYYSDLIPSNPRILSM